MLFVLNKTRSDTFHLIEILGGKEDKAILLINDAVYYATPFFAERLREVGGQAIYAAKDAVEARAIEISSKAVTMNYDEMATLIMECEDRTISL